MTYYIYKIYDIKCDDIFYIGSTNNISKRKCSHKKCVNNKRSKKYKLKLYSYIRNCGGWDNFDMVLIEEIENKQNGLKREYELIKELKPKLNTFIPK